MNHIPKKLNTKNLIENGFSSIEGQVINLWLQSDLGSDASKAKAMNISEQEFSSHIVTIHRKSGTRNAEKLVEFLASQKIIHR